MTTRVILVRHGESTYNVERRIQGHCDESDLTATGRMMARQVGAALQEISFHAVYSSPLKRASQTTELVLSVMIEGSQSEVPAPQFTDDLKEVNLLLWEGILFTEVQEKFPEQYQHWQTQPHLLCMQVPGPEGTGTIDFYPFHDLFDQARRFWRLLLAQHPNETVLVVSHSGITRALLSTALGLTPESFHRFMKGNCTISILNFAGELGGQVQFESLNLTAHLGQPLPSTRKGHRGPRVLLVRHGETQWNREGRFQGQIDVPLNETGRQQGAKAAEFLKDIPIHRAVSSSMLRPKETAEIILKFHPGVELELRDDLREISHGLWEGKLEAEIEEISPGLLQQWKQAPETVQMPEGENLKQVWERAIAGWRAIVTQVAETSEPVTILVVAHDAVNKALLCHLFDLGPEFFWSFKQGNGAVSVIDYPKGPDHPPILQALNITSHLAGGVLDKTAAGAL